MREFVFLASLSLLAGAAAHAAPLAATVIADLRSHDADPRDAAGRGGVPSGLWDYAAFDPRTGDLLIARMNGVQAVRLGDERGRAPLGSSLLAPGRHVHAVVPLPDGNLLFTQGDDDIATVVDGRAGTLVGSIPTGRRPDGAIYDAVRREMLVMNGGDGSVTRIDVGRGPPHAIGRIDIGGKLEAPAVDDQDRLFVNVEDRNALAIVSLRGKGALLRQASLAGCDEPGGLAYEPKSRLLVSACANGVAVVLDRDGKEVATLPIGAHPDAVMADPLHARVFIPCGGDGTLDEIILSGTPRIGRVWNTRSGARTGAFDPRTGRVYLPYGDIRRAPGNALELVADTFGVLVVDIR